MLYSDFQDVLEQAAPNGTVVFTDGAFVVGAHVEVDVVRIFRNDDLGYDVGAQLVPRHIAEARAKEPTSTGNILDELTAQCQHGGYDVVVSLPGEMFFRHVEHLGEDDNGNVMVKAGERRYNLL